MTTTQTEVIELQDTYKADARKPQLASGLSTLSVVESTTPDAAIDTSRVSLAPAYAVPVRTSEMRRKANIHFAALCFCLFLNGWNDGTTGTLLPRIQEVYHVRILPMLLTASRLD